MTGYHGTTVLAVLGDGHLAIGGDGQVSTGEGTILKHGARKVRRLRGGKVLAGFAGAVADAITLLEALEAKLEAYQGNVPRAAVELGRQWRTDRTLHRLEAQILVGDSRHLLVISGSGEVIEPDDGVAAVGSGGAYALAAARALVRHGSMNPGAVVDAALRIAAEICVYTNDTITIEEVTADDGVGAADAPPGGGGA